MSDTANSETQSNSHYHDVSGNPYLINIDDSESNGPPYQIPPDDHYHVTNDSEILVRTGSSSTRSRRNGVQRSHDPDEHHVLQNRTLLDGQSVSVHDDTCHSGERTKMDKTTRNQLIIVSVLSFLFMVAEIVGGLLSNSLALVTDATHLASDLTSFLVSLLAVWLATKPPTNRMTFGFHRAEVLGALFSILVIWIVTGILVYIGVKRVIHQSYDIHADTMLITSGIGVGFNIVIGLVLHSGFFKKCALPTSFGHNHSHSHGNHSHGNHSHENHSHGNPNNHSNNNNYNTNNQPLLDNNTPSTPPIFNDPSLNSQRLSNVVASDEASINSSCSTLETNSNHDNHIETYKSNINIRAAILHVIGDLIQSIGVFIAAIVIKVKPEYKLADPICTFVFSVLVLITTIAVLRDICRIIMEAVPGDCDSAQIHNDLADIPGVKSVHCLRIWGLTVGKVAMTVHLAVDVDASWSQVLRSARTLVRTKHHMMVSTIQVEEYDDAMAKCTDCLR